jgi:hypothetical protein
MKVSMSKMIIKTCFPLIALLLMLGCKNGAENFFSGRPSGMSMIHNQIADGSPDAMMALLKVPSRFPDAKNEHIADWQNSVVAWWQVAEKRQLMISVFTELTTNESAEVRKWVETKVQNTSEQKTKTLNGIKTSIASIH